MTFEQKLKVDDRVGHGSICKTRRENKSVRNLEARTGQRVPGAARKPVWQGGWWRGGSVLEDRPEGWRVPCHSGPHGLCHALAFTLTQIGNWQCQQVFHWHDCQSGCRGWESEGVGVPAAGWVQAGSLEWWKRCGIMWWYRSHNLRIPWTQLNGTL